METARRSLDSPDRSLEEKSRPLTSNRRREYRPEESAAAQPGKCSECGFVNKDGSKFCEECGTKI